MGSVWKRLQRAGKRAAKVRFEVTFEELLLEGGESWQPDKLSVVWSRRGRKIRSKPRRWQPGIENPFRGAVVWVIPESIEVTVTLYRDPQATTYDAKQWNVLIENESRGRRWVVAGTPLDLGRLAGGPGAAPPPLSLALALRPRSRRVGAAKLRLRLRWSLLREGRPTEQDLQSLASLGPPGDVGDLGDFESDPEDEDGGHGDPPGPGGHPHIPPMRPAALDALSSLGVPRLLDPSDLVRPGGPDTLGVLSYLSGVRAVLGTPPGPPRTPPDPQIRSGPPQTPPDPQIITGPPRTPPDPQISSGPPQITPDPPMQGEPPPQPGPPPVPPPRLRDPEMRRKRRSEKRGDPQMGNPPNGDPPNGDPPNGDPQMGTPPPGTPPNGDPPNGDTPPGTPPNRDPTDGDPQMGTPPNGDPPDGDTPRNPPTGAPPIGDTPRDPPTGAPPIGDTPRDPPPGTPPNGDPQTATPPNGDPPNGDPPNGDPQMGTPPPGTPPNEDPPTGSPPNGDPQTATPPNGDPPTVGPPPEDTPAEPEPPEEETAALVAQLLSLQREQCHIDAIGVTLERELRQLMDSGADPPREEQLLQQWLQLVNHKNELLRQQDQLRLLAEQQDLERRFERLNWELRGMLDTDERLKPPGQRQREQRLLQDLVGLVNQRDRLLRDMDERMREAEEEDARVQRGLERRRSARRGTCGIC